jgi:sigma-54 dependent transcriptional regulator, acetoin dehydrogenase operon transcriptional activator AcoR
VELAEVREVTPAAEHPVPPAAEANGGQRFSGLQYLRTGDPQLESVIQKVRRVLDRGIPLLILGETGTGKELLARAVHHDSNRSRQPFVAVNCASIPESLIEAELFGYEEGAFTGARRKGAPGRLVQANGGTLFLDEIGDMPLALQARLLRALQERSVTPLGSTKSIAVDIAVICACRRCASAPTSRPSCAASCRPNARRTRPSSAPRCWACSAATSGPATSASWPMCCARRPSCRPASAS